MLHSSDRLAESMFFLFCHMLIDAENHRMTQSVAPSPHHHNALVLLYQVSTTTCLLFLHSHVFAALVPFTAPYT